MNTQNMKEFEELFSNEIDEEEFDKNVTIISKSGREYHMTRKEFADGCNSDKEIISGAKTAMGLLDIGFESIEAIIW